MSLAHPAASESPPNDATDVAPRSETSGRGTEQARAFLAFCANPPAAWIPVEEAYREAEEMYGDDDARALADLEAGRHPLQRRQAEPQRS